MTFYSPVRLVSPTQRTVVACGHHAASGLPWAVAGAVCNTAAVAIRRTDAAWCSAAHLTACEVQAYVQLLGLASKLVCNSAQTQQPNLLLRRRPPPLLVAQSPLKIKAAHTSEHQ